MIQDNPVSVATLGLDTDTKSGNAMVESLFVREVALTRFFANASASSQVA